jgi:heme/copper-type cytochrome/quinol oxidase subunit 2
MKGQLTVESEADFQAWLDQLEKAQNATMPPATAAKSEGKSE